MTAILDWEVEACTELHNLRAALYWEANNLEYNSVM